MLTAVTTSGEKICLAENVSKSTLLQYKETEQFFCPSCQEKMIIKLGEKRIYHFAHTQGSECTRNYEAESGYHLEGKKQLYLWLRELGLHPVLEQYDPKIKQRPDITFSLDDKRYAVEYQCSPIPVALFKSRTISYLNNHYLPIWILGGTQFNRKATSTVSLSAFHYFFLRKDESIPFFCPNQSKFILLNSLQSLSSRNALTNIRFHSIREKGTFSAIFKENHTKIVNQDNWYKQIQNSKMRLVHFKGETEKMLLNELYRNRFNPFLLPPFVGIPVKFSSFLETSPVVWQTLVYLDLVSLGMKRKLFSLQDLLFLFKQRIKNKQISIRELPLMTGIDATDPIKNYIQILVGLGFLTQHSSRHYKLNPYTLAKNTYEQTEREKQFYEKNKSLWTLL